MIRTVEVRRRGEGGGTQQAAYGVPYRAESHPPDLEQEAAEERARAKLGVYAHLGAYALVMTLLVLFNMVQSPQRLWFVWPLIGWGVAVIAHAVGVFSLQQGSPAERYLVDRELRRA